MSEQATVKSQCPDECLLRFLESWEDFSEVIEPDGRVFQLCKEHGYLHERELSVGSTHDWYCIGKATDIIATLKAMKQ